ncbi:ATP-dependent helicase HrpB [Alphaproteobacteria bacterium]|nr:ATP-dependent helicase HrpB [Alphaproteobacteria bacterium]
MKLPNFTSPLPIDSYLEEVESILAERCNLIIEAEPGSGKTTRVPLALIDLAEAAQKKIILLGPRRVTVRSAANRLAEQLGEKIGERVGYRIRSESKTSRQNLIEVMTEGLFVRKLVNDPELSDCYAVIFDEVHERSLDGDLGLTLCHDIQQALRPDLRMIAMSATLKGLALEPLLPNAKKLTVPGKTHPLELRWAQSDNPFFDFSTLPNQILSVIHQTEGDILVFLPGEAEIRRTERDLQQNQTTGILVAPLYGSQSSKDQQTALAPSRDGRRKILLTTNIAESSLTVPGVRTVIDTGLERRPSFDLALNATTLATAPISQASADQRAGRAARLGPGICYRLWSERSHRSRERQRPPEIENSNLSSLALNLAGLGVNKADQLTWLTPPPKTAFDLALKELESLHIVQDGRITTLGQQALRFGTSPRLASLLIRGKEQNAISEAGIVATLLDDPSLLADRREIELKHQSDALLGHTIDNAVNRGKVASSKRTLANYIKILEGNLVSADLRVMANLLAQTFPNLIAQARPNQPGSFFLANGTGAETDAEHPLSTAQYLAVGSLIKTKAGKVRISLAAELPYSAIVELFGEEFYTEENLGFNLENSEFVAQSLTKFGSLTLKRQRLTKLTTDQVFSILKGLSAKSSLDFLPWSKSTEELVDRLQFLHSEAPELWPSFSREFLTANLSDWLPPYLVSVQKFRDLTKLNLEQIFLDQLPWEQREQLEKSAPPAIKIPTGENRRIDYSGAQPTLSCRIQELFGMIESPRIGPYQKPILIQLLSPAQRPVQTTQDLKSFWETTYKQVKAELKGRYPKHFWPDDPLTAEATSRAKPRKR